MCIACLHCESTRVSCQKMAVRLYISHSMRSLVILYTSLLLFCVLLSSVQCTQDDTNVQGEYSAGAVVRFNNPKLLRDLEDENEVDPDDPYADKTQEPVDPTRIGGVHLKNKASMLGYSLTMLTIEEMAVTHMQSIYDSLQYEERSVDVPSQLQQLTSIVTSRFNKYITSLQSLKHKVEGFYSLHLRQDITASNTCCDIAKDILRYDDRYQMYVSRDNSCDLLPAHTSDTARSNVDGQRRAMFNPGRNLTDAFQSTEQSHPSIAWQYFISVAGVHNEYPAHNFHNRPYVSCKEMHNIRHRNVFVSSLHPAQKHVVIVIDHGQSMSRDQMLTAKAIAHHLLQSLSVHDKVNIVGMSSSASTATSDLCHTQRLVPLTKDLRNIYTMYINNLHIAQEPTNHTAGMERAFHLLRNTFTTTNTTPSESFILYISRGLMTDLSDASNVLEVIRTENDALNDVVHVNTYAVIDRQKPVIWEKDFMENIAAHTQRAPGRMVAINSTKDLNVAIGDFFSASDQTVEDQPIVSLPYRDPVGKGIIMSLSWPTFTHTTPIGVVGYDIYHGDLMEPVSYFGSGGGDGGRSMGSGAGQYAFMIDTHGATLSHPALGKPVGLNQRYYEPAHTDIEHFEPYEGFDVIRQQILSESQGLARLQVERYIENNSMSHMQSLLPKYVSVTYHWQHLHLLHMADVQFVLVIKTVEDVIDSRDITHVSVPKSEPLLVYHRLDLLPSDNTCMHLKQLASKDTSALFLAARSFTRPFEYLSQHETKRMVQGYLAYLNDNTKLINNPVIKESIKKDVAVLSRINSHWLTKHKNSPNNNYIVRRYVATPNGAFVVYPGTLMNQAYDPTTQEWFTRAMQNPGKVTLTAPYLDHGGAGYIVTISHTIYEGKTQRLHGPLDRIVAVMGMDVTLGYFYKMLITTIPVCESEHIRCLLMDDRGYLIAHQSLIEPNGRGPVEQQHIIHKEAVVANDMLSHRGFVQKKICNQYVDRTVQRYYHFNTSMKGIVTNLIHGEHCSHYQVTAVPGSNMFVGIVNQTCKDLTAFCPCSMVDRLCLNCQRMEPSECECPCECPMSVNTCTGHIDQSYIASNPSCGPRAQDVPRANLPDQVVTALPQCMQSHCAARKTKRECLGVLDCEWCALGRDGVTPLTDPFCSTQRICFAGVLEARTPYHDEINAAAQQHKRITVTSTPIGPVAGGIMACFLLLGLGICWYKHRVHRMSRRPHYVSTIQVADGDIPMPQLDHHDASEQDPRDPENTDDGSAGHTNNIVLATFDTPSVSPYKVNTSYQRPTPQIGDSDHGYSTMTPQETDNNSENASTTTSVHRGGNIIGRDRYRPSGPGLYKAAIGSDGQTSLMPVLPPPPTSRRSPTPTTASTQLALGQTVIGANSCGQRPASIPEQTVLVDTSVVDAPQCGDSVPPGQTTLVDVDGAMAPQSGAAASYANVLTTTAQIHTH